MIEKDKKIEFTEADQELAGLPKEMPTYSVSDAYDEVFIQTLRARQVLDHLLARSPEELSYTEAFSVFPHSRKAARLEELTRQLRTVMVREMVFNGPEYGILER